MNMKTKPRVVCGIGLVLLVAVGVFLGWLYFWLFHGLPLPERMPSYFNASDGYEYIPLAEIPVDLRMATIAVQDRAFYARDRQPGFRAEVRALYFIFRCSWERCLSEKYQTIPTRLAADLMLISQQDRCSPLRWDLRHFVLTRRIVSRYSLNEILEFHLNSTRYANQVYGVEAAAQHHFGKHVYELNLTECVALPVITTLPDPDPDHDLELVQDRLVIVLDMLVENHYLDLGVAESAKKEPLVFKKH